MSKKAKTPTTTAVRALRQAEAQFTDHPYKYIDQGGTRVAAESLGLDEHTVIKTIVMEDQDGNAFIVLMHGNREISAKKLARILNVKTVTPCDPSKVTRITGYQVGGTSPFGTLKELPVYMEKSIMDLETIYINGGKRGFLVGISPAEASRILNPVLVETAA